LGTKGQHATSRTPKLLVLHLTVVYGRPSCLRAVLCICSQFPSEYSGRFEILFCLHYKAYSVYKRAVELNI
jgi:hypothetical protein